MNLDDLINLSNNDASNLSEIEQVSGDFIKAYKAFNEAVKKSNERLENKFINELEGYFKNKSGIHYDVNGNDIEIKVGNNGSISINISNSNKDGVPNYVVKKQFTLTRDGKQEVYYIQIPDRFRNPSIVEYSEYDVDSLFEKSPATLNDLKDMKTMTSQFEQNISILNGAENFEYVFEAKHTYIRGNDKSNQLDKIIESIFEVSKILK